MEREHRLKLLPDQPQPVFVFIDTNIFLQYQTFTMVAWPEMFGGAQVCLVIAPSVQREIDHEKDNPRDARLNARARAVLPLLRPLLLECIRTNMPALVRENVTITAIPIEPAFRPDEWQDLGLDSALPDDRLLASLFCFRRDNPGTRCVLATHDFGPGLKAAHHNVEVLDPAAYPDILPPLPQSTEEADELRRLRTENERLKSQIAGVEFGFVDPTGSPSSLVERPGTPRQPKPPQGYIRTSEQFASYIAQEEAHRDKILNRAIVQGVEEALQTKYKHEYDRYLEHVGTSFMDAQSRQYGIECNLRFLLGNTGNILLTDLRVEIEFPEWTFLLRHVDMEDNIWDDAAMPQRPPAEWLKKPPQQALRAWSDLLGMSSNFTASSLVPSSIIRNAPRTQGFFYSRVAAQ